MTSKFTKQMWEAAAWTFMEAFFATIGPAIVVVNVGDWNGLLAIAGSAGISALSAVISLIKSLVVRDIGAQDSVFISGGNEVG
jgi:hypothetical protein